MLAPRLRAHLGTLTYYFSTQKLTRKSDAYAFGLLLLEVLCGRSAVDSGVAEDERILTKWARDKISKGEVDQIVASSLREEISPESLKVFVEVAERCLHDEPKKRPTTPAEKKDWRKPKWFNPLRFWAWGAFRNRIKPSKEKEISFELEISDAETYVPEICEADIKLTKFDLTSIAAATDQFSPSQKNGEGGSGSVYKAVLPTGRVVAVKRFFQMQHDEFKNEILLAPSLLHRNIVERLGYCIHEQREMIIVYEYMARGTLRDHLYNSENSPLTWKQRLQRIELSALRRYTNHHPPGCQVPDHPIG